MRRLDKIKDRFEAATQKSNFKQYQSDQAHRRNQQTAETFRSGTTAAARKQRKEDYKGR